MAAIIAGLRGGIAEDKSASKLAKTSISLLAGHLDSVTLTDFLRHGGLPRFLSMVVNDKCNLHCRHCYLQTADAGTSLLTNKEWECVVEGICHSDVRMVCLSGKEVFVGNTGSAVLSMLQHARAEHRAFFNLGAITNGTLLQSHKSNLIKGSLSYLDISLDGLREDHDSIRGQGAFDRTVANVQWLVPILGNSLFSMVTLNSENSGQIPKIVTNMSQLGFQGMGFGFYLPQSYTDISLSLGSHNYAWFFKTLHELASIEVTQPISVLIDLDTSLLDQMLAFLRSNWFNPTTLKVDRMGELYNEYQFGNGVTLQFRITPYPTGIWKSSRLNPDGSYLAAEDTVDAKLYQQYALANILDFNFDLEAMNLFVMDSPRVKHILSDYTDRILPKIVDAAHSRFTDTVVPVLVE